VVARRLRGRDPPRGRGVRVVARRPRPVPPRLGASVVADEYLGTALTLQTGVGFLLTVGSIQGTPLIADAVGWRWAFAPLVATLAMARLRARPEASRLAGGRG
jgi:hypothetical protein